MKVSTVSDVGPIVESLRWLFLHTCVDLQFHFPIPNGLFNQLQLRRQLQMQRAETNGGCWCGWRSRSLYGAMNRGWRRAVLDELVLLSHIQVRYLPLQDFKLMFHSFRFSVDRRCINGIIHRWRWRLDYGNHSGRFGDGIGCYNVANFTIGSNGDRLKSGSGSILKEERCSGWQRFGDLFRVSISEFISV